MTAAASKELSAEPVAAPKDGPPERRTPLLRGVADLLASDADRPNPFQLSVFDVRVLRGAPDAIARVGG